MKIKPRSHILRVRFSDQEWQSLKKLAALADCSMSALVRDHLDHVQIRNRHDERQTAINLNRINANLNMIARWVNTHKSLADRLEVIPHLIAIQRAIKGMTS